MSINFNKTNWQDSPNTNTPITALELNRMEQGIQDCVDAFNQMSAVYTFKGVVETYGELPIINNIGDTYNVASESKTYAWNGTDWVELNISFDTTTITIDYPIEIGRSGIWTYEKWNSGKVVCYCRPAVVFENVFILQTYVRYPIELTSVLDIQATLNFAFNNQAEFFNANIKVQETSDPQVLLISVQDPSGSFTEDFMVLTSLRITGRWK